RPIGRRWKWPRTGMLVSVRFNQVPGVPGDSERQRRARVMGSQTLQIGEAGMIVRTCCQQPTVIGWKCRPLVFGLVVSGVLGTIGCTQEALDPVQTVAWYKTHEVERIAMVTKCHNNPGQLNTTPNCINAQQAVDDIAMGR
ncbi:MAG: EexN family lipoprotein, partial [Nitrospira sp.]|nr:EexN family lipoprotein [Nitrospira sp.]